MENLFILILWRVNWYDERMPDDAAQHSEVPLDQPDEDDLLTVSEVAERLTVSAPTVYIAMREGRLPFVIKYGKRLITRVALAEYKARTRPTGEKPRGRPKPAQPA